MINYNSRMHKKVTSGSKKDINEKRCFINKCLMDNIENIYKLDKKRLSSIRCFFYTLMTYLVPHIKSISK